MLLRLASLEGINRYHTIFQHTPPSRALVFSEQATFYPSGAKRNGSGTTAYAWYIWDKNATPDGTQLVVLKARHRRRHSSILLP